MTRRDAARARGGALLALVVVALVAAAGAARASAAEAVAPWQALTLSTERSSTPSLPRRRTTPMPLRASPAAGRRPLRVARGRPRPLGRGERGSTRAGGRRRVRRRNGAVAAVTAAIRMGDHPRAALRDHPRRRVARRRSTRRSLAARPRVQARHPFLAPERRRERRDRPRSRDGAVSPARAASVVRTDLLDTYDSSASLVARGRPSGDDRRLPARRRRARPAPPPATGTSSVPPTGRSAALARPR